jgi:hypothetical protein
MKHHTSTYFRSETTDNAGVDMTAAYEWRP